VRLRALALTALIGLLGPAAGRAQEPSTAAATPPVTVTDVDLAGGFEVPVRPPQRCDARIYRDVDPPRIDLEFRLTDDGGRVVRADRRVLRDSNYVTRSALPPSDPLRHEKRLLLDWFESEFNSRGATR
jgi:hypothetical protein